MYDKLERFSLQTMEQHAFKNVKSCWSTKITFYLETFGIQSSNLDLIFVYVYNTTNLN
jgi:hypothetical protein